MSKERLAGSHLSNKTVIQPPAKTLSALKPTCRVGFVMGTSVQCAYVFSWRAQNLKSLREGHPHTAELATPKAEGLLSVSRRIPPGLCVAEYALVVGASDARIIWVENVEAARDNIVIGHA